MRTIPDKMATNLAVGATTHCRCWKIVPNQGDALGFTDHDCDLSFENVEFEASSGFEASSVERALGLNIDNVTARGALKSEKLSEALIGRGAFDGAEIFQWIVDWRDVEQRVLTFRGEIGEIRRSGAAFEVEVRGLAEKLNRPSCRKILHVCDAVFGDVRCGIDATTSEFTGLGAVLEVAGRDLNVSGLEQYPEDWFSGGRLTWSSGALAGDEVRIASHQKTPDGSVVTLALDPLGSVMSGVSFVITAGCDKSYETCRDRFDNLLNFRGFPFVPGENWIAAFPHEGGVHDGGSRVDG